ncbi:class I adenylate-forming enzyme family protein [Ruegeria profundi]|uniref:class I adenylate-forming enzyme family protein n=1 Tax=Ruegeria profundi TaxID=1685378 RepID=UPI001CD27FB0|nr:AMP-binding protein [Ruegeria profundi]MCA0928404.1 AMP-binding protein [Ruegeria profundi]
MNRIHEILIAADQDAVAISDYDGRAYTYGELNEMSRQAAERLIDHGVRPGDRVLLISENCAAYLVAIFALSRLDAWTVLVNARLTDTEVLRLSELSEARCALFTPDASPASAAHADRMGRVDLKPLACGSLTVSAIRDAPVEPVEPDRSQTAILIYTTGTVGEPKGVMLTHGNLLFVSQLSADARRLTPSDVMLAVLPGTHIFGLSSVFLGAVRGGTRLIVRPRFDVDDVIEQLKTATLFPAVPQIFAAINKRLREQKVEKADHNLRYIYAGGAPLDMALKTQTEDLFGLPLHNGYGLSECSPSVALTLMDAPRNDSAVGPPLPGVDVRLENPNDDGVGELCVRGENVMKGYFHNPEATRKAMTDDGFFRTGDLAKQEEDGTLHIVGRAKELIIHSGFNVYPPEVEAVLAAHPAVTLAAVVGRAHDSNEDVIGFVSAHAKVSESELRDWARERMAAYKVPARVIVSDALPQAATGKIIKHKLLSHFADVLDSAPNAE